MSGKLLHWVTKIWAYYRNGKGGNILSFQGK